jgi:chemotaxis protein MotB
MSTHRARHGGGHEESGSERWLLTYADMITLLLALFVVLFAFSTIDAKKFLEFRVGLTSAFSPSAVTTSGAGGNGLLQQQTLATHPGQSSTQSPIVTPNSSPGETAQQLQNEIKEELKKAGLAKYATVTTTSQGVVVQVLADKVFFATDSAALGAIGDRVVDLIASVVVSQPNNLMVEGYTDNQAITGGPYGSNWELSAARAAEVANRLNVTDKIAADRLSATGYSDTHPQASNATPASRAENRRIDVVILNNS